LVQALHAAANGDALIAPDMTVCLLASFADMHRRVAPAQPTEALTTGEEEVLVTVAKARASCELASELHIALSTAKTHIANLMTNLVPAIASRSPCGPMKPAASPSDLRTHAEFTQRAPSPANHPRAA
jgi:DNA-binding CsgD family transcriptional regulator